MPKLRWTLWVALLGLLGLAIEGCQPDNEIITQDPSAVVVFSRDTVLFDTLFTTLGSTTRRLKAINLESQAIRFSSIGLARGQDSPYRLYVNGKATTSVQDQFLRGGDSLLFLVEVTIDPRNVNTPFLERDSIVFRYNGREEHVKLLAWGQDALFVGNVVLDCNTTWTAQRPVVLYDDVLVDSGCTLTVEPGTKIFASSGAGLFVGGRLNAVGDSARRILFEQVRQEVEFQDQPGQWDGITFLPTTSGSEIGYAHIRNANTGIYLGVPDDDTVADLVLHHTLIENMAFNGLVAFTSDLYAYNVEISHCLDFVAANLAGGHYRYDHCTFYNHNDFQRNNPAVFWSNVYDTGQGVLDDPLTVRLRNCVVYGTEEDELLVDARGASAVVISGAANFIKSQLELFPTTSNFVNIDPGFVDAGAYELQPDSAANLINRGRPLGIDTDLRGAPRNLPPDVGAYEYQN